MRGFRADAADHRPRARAVPDLSAQGAPPHLEHELPAEGRRVVRDRLRPGRPTGPKARRKIRRKLLERRRVEQGRRRIERQRLEQQRRQEHGQEEGRGQGSIRRRLTRTTAVVGTDTGGTFTDFVALVGRRLLMLKVRSTPADPARAVAEGLRQLVPGTAPRLHYGSTVATNALLERRGARVVLLTTRGFEDLLEIGRQTRPELYDLEPRRPEPLVP